MNDFSAPPILRYVEPATATAWPCVMCWGKRFVMTQHRDACGRPICADCRTRTDRVLQMPSFVVEHIMETMQ